MTTPPNTPTHWRPRFSVRTLVVMVTLVCAYAACWGPTKKWGEAHVSSAGGISARTFAVVPLVVANDELSWTTNGDAHVRAYYFWFFGCVSKLPYERDIAMSAEDQYRVLGDAFSSASAEWTRDPSLEERLSE